jgi:hypothetical protein
MADDRNELRPLDLLSWFSEDELKACPHCGERGAVPRETGPSVCLVCEVVWLEGTAAE